MADSKNTHDACALDSGDCGVPASRRQFLRDSFLSVAGALVAVGVSRRSALAMPLEFTDALSRRGGTVSYAVPSVDGAQVDKSNDVILVRWQQTVYAFSLSCPHQNTALKWDDRDKGFQCPKHHSRFRANGEYIPDSGRATRNMDRYAISRDASGIHVDVNTVFEQDTDGARWAAAVVKL